jgi:TMEM175 potassium channel family protein
LSSNPSDGTPGVRLSESSRVEAFSDAVFAIVITILVLDLRVPQHEPGQLLAALAGLWTSVLAFLLSFVRVGVVWLNHHGLFSRVSRVDRALLWMNFGLLATCMLMPFPTAVLADALRDGTTSDLRVATILYASIGAVQLAAWLPIYPYLRDHPELSAPGADAAHFHAERIRPWVGVGVDLLAVAVALFAPIAALGLWSLSLIFLATTSDGMRRPSLLTRRRSRPRHREPSR